MKVSIILHYYDEAICLGGSFISGLSIHVTTSPVYRFVCFVVSGLSVVLAANATFTASKVHLKKTMCTLQLQ